MMSGYKCRKKTHYMEVFIVSWAHFFKAISEREMSQCAHCERCGISVSILCDSPASLKDVTVKRATKKDPSLNIELPHDGM